MFSPADILEEKLKHYGPKDTLIEKHMGITVGEVMEVIQMYRDEVEHSYPD